MHFATSQGQIRGLNARDARGGNIDSTQQAAEARRSTMGKFIPMMWSGIILVFTAIIMLKRGGENL